MNPALFPMLSQMNPVLNVPSYCLNNVAYLLIARTIELGKQPLIDNGCVNTQTME
jgi:hypothetical protein